MKKFLSTAAALGLVVGLAATASALELKVKGSYDVDGYYLNQGLGAASGAGTNPWDFSDPYTRAGFMAVTGIEGVGDDSKSDDWYWHEFRLQPTLQINDKLELRGDIRLVDSNSVWGAQDDLMRFDGGGIRMDKLWMIYDSPVGRIEVGRRPAGSWQYDFVNSGTAADRIMWWAPAMDNFKAYAFLQKSLEQDGYSLNDSDLDTDYYEVAGGYGAEGINAWLGLGWNADRSKDVAVTGFSTDTYRIKGYGDVKISDMFMALGEFDYKWGTREYNSGAADSDISSLAGLVAGVGMFGDLTTVLGYAYISGQEGPDAQGNADLTAYDTKNGMGADFEPLYILTGSACNILNGDLGSSVVGDAVRTSGAHAVVLLADFKASEDLTLHGGLGWGKADDTSGLAALLGLPDNIDDAYGYEVDLGLAYQLYQNLTYEVHFGWWAVGDFAELGVGVQTEDVYLLSHHLSMQF